MLYRLFLPFFILLTVHGTAQFKNDNIKYKTVFPEDLCRALQEHKGYILLDVRSSGEFCDTSSSVNFNIGHLKNAINIDIQQLPKRLDELKEDKNKPVFVYCSHSQRSRKASELLADSGFSQVFNINGGMTAFNLLKEHDIPCAVSFYETNNHYHLLSPLDLIKTVEKDSKNIFILDIRKDSVYNGISTDEKLNAYGKLANAVNIPLAVLPRSLQYIPKGGTVIIVDDYGTEGPMAAAILYKNGYKDLDLLFNGMDMWAETERKDLPGKENYWIHPSGYKLITGDEFNELARKPGVGIIDVRTTEEFTNKAKESWRNKGNIKNAVNIPFASLAGRISEIEKFKNTPVVVYHFGSSQEAFKAAKLLTQAGFKNVNVLLGGIWDLRWRAANIKGKSALNDWVENIPPDNL